VSKRIDFIWFESLKIWLNVVVKILSCTDNLISS